VRKFVGRNETVLDFGCGFQSYLLNHIRNDIKEGIGIDYDANESRSIDNVRLMKFHYKGRFPFEDKKFDKVFMLAVFEHIPLDETVSLLTELKRILKDDGRIVLTIPTPKGKPIMEFLAFQLGVISKDEIADHKKYYAKEDIQAEAVKAGLSLEYHSYFQFGWNSLQVLKKQAG
jgi:SAM-dependent methyltransferase